MTVISSRGCCQPPVEALSARGGLGKPPRVCSGRTSWTPATARQARPPLASTHHHSAPAEGVLQSQELFQHVLVKHSGDQPAQTNCTMAVGKRKQKTCPTRAASWQGAVLAARAGWPCANRWRYANGSKFWHFEYIYTDKYHFWYQNATDDRYVHYLFCIVEF